MRYCKKLNCNACKGINFSISGPPIKKTLPNSINAYRKEIGQLNNFFFKINEFTKSQVFQFKIFYQKFLSN